ncbi:hypothetical protein N9Q05_02675 [bacterium]|nr:hypothetical protein [bacterium]
MFSSDDLLRLFKQLALIAADKDSPLKSAATLLSEQYLIYLNKKSDDLDNDLIKPNYFTAMFNNLIDKPEFDSEKIRAIYQDLKEKQSQHKILLEEEIDLPERLRTEWDKWIVIKSSSQESRPTDLKSGYERGVDSILPRKSHLSQSSQLEKPTKISIGALFQNNLKKIKVTLKIICSYPALYAGDVYEQDGFDVICNLIKNSGEDAELKELAVKALAILGEYFFCEQSCIEDKILQETLNDYLINEADMVKRTLILRTLTYCHPNCFTNTNLSTLVSILVSSDTPIEQRYYTFECLVPLFYSEALLNQIGVYIVPIIRLLTLEYHEKSHRSQIQFQLLKANVTRFLLRCSHDNNLAPYLQQDECIKLLIELICLHNYNKSEEYIRISFLTSIFGLSVRDSDFITRNAIMNPSNLDLLLDFLLYSKQDRQLSMLSKIFLRVGINDVISNLFFEKGITLYLLNLLSSSVLIKKETHALVGSMLASVCSDSPDNCTLCIKHNFYTNILSFYENAGEMDANVATLFSGTLCLFVHASHNIICQDQTVINFVVNHLDKMPEKARVNLLLFLDFAIKENPAEIKLKSKKILASIVSWLKTDKPNRELVLKITTQLLKLNPELLNYFVQSTLYNDVKGLLYVSDIKTVRSTVFLISEIIAHPDIEDDLLSTPVLLLQLHRLSIHSEDKLTREYADLVFTRRDLQEAERLRNNGQFNEAESLYTKILGRENPSDVNTLALKGIELLGQAQTKTTTQKR